MLFLFCRRVRWASPRRTRGPHCHSSVTTVSTSVSLHRRIWAYHPTNWTRRERRRWPVSTGQEAVHPRVTVPPQDRRLHRINISPPPTGKDLVHYSPPQVVIIGRTGFLEKWFNTLLKI